MLFLAWHLKSNFPSNSKLIESILEKLFILTDRSGEQTKFSFDWEFSSLCL